MRYLALYHFKNGVSRTQIASLLGVSRTNVIHGYQIICQMDWMVCLINLNPALSSHQIEQLKSFIEKNAIKQNSGRLIAEDIKVYIYNVIRVSYSLANVYRLLHAQGFSSRSQHPRQSNEAQEAFKKFLDGNDPSHPGSSST